jgi:hypothetical protein
MNKLIYNSFKNEMQKQAFEPSHFLGKGIEKFLHWAWKNPKTAIGIGAGAMLIPKILKIVFPAGVLINQHNQNGIMNTQTDLLKGILAQQQLSNYTEPEEQPMYTKIERSLI